MHYNFRESKNDSSGSKIFYAVSLGLELGFLIVVPLIFFLLLGLYFDRRFNTLPIFLLIAIIASLVATIFEVRHLILPFLEKRSQKK